MKILFMTAAIAAMTLFASCSKDSAMSDSITQPMQGSVVSISFAEEAQTRAFFDDSAASETWEAAIKSATIFAFDPDSDALIVRRDFNTSELDGLDSETTFALPGVVAGDEVDIFVIANCDIDASVVTGDKLKAVINSNLSKYNGTFEDMNNPNTYDKGFVMASSNEVTIEEGTTKITAQLERTVAKVAIQMTLADGFSDRYSGDVKINSISVSNTPSTTTLHSSFPFATAPEKDFTFSQDANISEEIFQNLFYIYESETPENDTDKVLLTIAATYDMDGDFTTESDQTPIEYTLNIEDDNITKIDRNSYYRISGSINGLNGADASIKIEVSDWTLVDKKEVGLGN
ncbi:MAG: hypothetical protein SNI87_07110 [Rikenellaceae bacterium]